MAEQFPGSFPSGQGSDLAGTIHVIGAEVTGWRVGDEVLGWKARRNAQADYVSVPATQLTMRPPAADWVQVASLYVAGCTAYALVRTVAPLAGETVAVSAATGRSVCSGYVQLAIGLGVPPERTATIIDFEEAEKHGAKVVMGGNFASPAVLAELAEHVADAELTSPIAATYPLEDLPPRTSSWPTGTPAARSCYTCAAERVSAQVSAQCIGTGRTPGYGLGGGGVPA